MGAQLKTVGKVLIVMALVLFAVAPLVRDTGARVMTYSVDHALAPAYRFLLLHVNPPMPDAATFCYACALMLGAAGVSATATGYCMRRKTDVA